MWIPIFFIFFLLTPCQEIRVTSAIAFCDTIQIFILNFDESKDNAIRVLLKVSEIPNYNLKIYFSPTNSTFI